MIYTRSGPLLYLHAASADALDRPTRSTTPEIVDYINGLEDKIVYVARDDDLRVYEIR